MRARPRATWLKVIACFLMAILPAGCGPTPTPPPVSPTLAQQEMTPTPPSSPTSAPTPLPTSTSTPVPTHTPSPQPTATAAPSSTPMPTLPPIRLESDSSTVYVSLEEAVAAAVPGDTIFLAADSYFLSRPLDISKPLHLVGEGMDQTEIRSEAAGGYLLRFDGAGPFVLEGITFLYHGDEEADVVVVDSGEIDFSGCRFSGAIWLGDAFWPAGLRLGGDTTGIVQDCVTYDNANVGIQVEGRAQVTLARNDCSASLTGISVFGEPLVILEGNISHGNGFVGIEYSSSADGVLRGNESGGNVVGIYLSGGQPLLEGNICSRNGMSGIEYWGSAGGVARQNICSENGRGIAVGGEATPTLEENVCNDNGVEGIAYLENAGGIARLNECRGNQVGIFVEATANPQLEDNDCRDNSEADIRDLRPQ